MNRLAAIIAAIHNAWLTIPLGIRTAISFSVAVVVASAIALVQGYGWLVPTSLDAVKGEAIAFLTYAVPILAVLVAQLVRSKIAPAIVTWFLSTFGYAPNGVLTSGTFRPPYSAGEITGLVQADILTPGEAKSILGLTPQAVAYSRSVQSGAWVRI